MLSKYPGGNYKCVLFVSPELNFAPERESPLPSLQSQNTPWEMKARGHLISNQDSVDWYSLSNYWVTNQFPDLRLYGVTVSISKVKNIMEKYTWNMGLAKKFVQGFL